MKKQFTFVVDNGPSEQPSSPLAQMCLVRLLFFLKLDKITQCSFAAYHSKRNYVERAHAEENRALLQHGPFKSDKVYPSAKLATENHKANIEAMAMEVKECLLGARFGGRGFQCYRGIKPSEYIFNDKQALHTFLSLTEELKHEFPDSYNTCTSNLTMMTTLEVAWGVDPTYCGKYSYDYSLLCNRVTEFRTGILLSSTLQILT